VRWSIFEKAGQEEERRNNGIPSRVARTKKLKRPKLDISSFNKDKSS